jgi:uncharacterized protein YukE
MKLFVSKTKDWAQKAQQLKAALEKVPPTVSEIREAVAHTTDQLRQLRAEVRSSVTELKADTDVQVSEALAEIKAGLSVFLEAGYELGGLDIEISPSQRVVLRLVRLETVRESVLRSLMAANEHQSVIHAILNALLKANQMADSVDLAGLEFRDVLVTVGPMPSVRACWKSDDSFEVEVATPSAASEIKSAVSSVAPPSTPVPASEPRPTYFGKSTYFDKRAPSSTKPAAPVEDDESTAEVAAAKTKSAANAEPHTASWTGSALERFKKDPHFSKYRR